MWLENLEAQLIGVLILTVCNLWISSLEKLVKILSNNNFKYLTEEFNSKNLEILKQNDAYPNEYTGSFIRFGEEKLPDKKCFYSCSVKDETTGDNN